MDEELKRIMLELTAHADDLQLFANGISEDAEGELAATEDAIYALIYALYQRYGELGLPIDYRTVKYLEDLKRRIREIRAAAFSESEDDVEGAAQEIAAEESVFWSDFFAFAFGATAVAPSKKRLERIAKYGVYNGNTRKQIFDKLTNGDIDRIYETIIDAFQKGGSVTAAVEAAKREMRKTRRFLKSEVDAIINGVANDAAMEFAAANKARLLYSAVLDDRVCAECASLDGNIYEYDDPDIPSLPRHVNCRCCLIPTSLDGEPIAPATFAEYIASLPPSEQRQRLGNAKYAAWKSGNYKLKVYETPNPGQRVSIAQMKS